MGKQSREKRDRGQGIRRLLADNTDANTSVALALGNLGGHIKVMAQRMSSVEAEVKGLALWKSRMMGVAAGIALVVSSLVTAVAVFAK